MKVRLTFTICLMLLLITYLMGKGGSLQAGGSKERADDSTARNEVVDPAPEPAGSYEAKQLTIEYAQGFSVRYEKDYKIVRVLTPWQDAGTTFEYILVRRGTEPPKTVPAGESGTGKVPGRDMPIIEVPIRSIVTMSTSYLPFLERLNAHDSIIGHDTFDYVYSPVIWKKIAAGEIQEVGAGMNANVEILIDMEPDVIMISAVGNEWDAHPKLIEAGLPVVINADYVETSPLGRAEWIKFISLFFDKEQEATDIFKGIVDEYKRVTELTKSVSYRPTVFNNAPFQGYWGVPGGESFIAKLLKDAGADYLWKDTDSAVSVFLDFEAVFEKAADADYWINLSGDWDTKEDIFGADNRFVNFKAYKTGNIYNFNKRKGPEGGNDFWESGPANPHIVLKDLVKIFHPELIPDHQLYYYKKIEP